MQLPSLALKHTFIHSFIENFSRHSLKTYRSSPCLEKGHTLDMRIQKLPSEQKKRDKNGLLCFIHLGKQQKNETNELVQTSILLTQTNHHAAVILKVIHTHSQKYSLLELTPFVFFVVFVILFLGKCKSSSFFIIHFFNSFTFFLYKRKKKC